MSKSTSWILASGAVGLVIAVIWFNAPLVPALTGAAGAALILYWRRRSTSA